MGETGIVTGFPSHPGTLPTGGKAEGVEMRLASGEGVFAAQANVELFG